MNMPVTRCLRGDAPAAELNAATAQRVAALRARGVVPGLVVISAGDDPASAVYVRNKLKKAGELGISARHVALPATATRVELLAAVDAANADTAVHALLVQLPLPDMLRGREAEIAQRIDPRKDADCFHPENLGLLLRETPRFLPCTPAGVCHLLQQYGIATAGQTVVVIGRSLIVGKPLAVMLARKGCGDATVIHCHTATRNLAELTRLGDIVIVAAGKPCLLTPGMLKPGATVIDVGMNRIPDAGAASGTCLVGDCDFAGLQGVAGAVTPVPGGVGLLTVAMLLRNVVTAAEHAADGT